MDPCVHLHFLYSFALYLLRDTQDIKADLTNRQIDANVLQDVSVSQLRPVQRGCSLRFGDRESRAERLWGWEEVAAGLPLALAVHSSRRSELWSAVGCEMPETLGLGALGHDEAAGVSLKGLRIYNKYYNK